MSAPLQGTASAAQAIERVKFTHDAMIDLIIAKPAITQNQIAAHFGYTAPWVSRIMNSDAFQARLAQRKEDLIDPSITATFDDKLAALADQSLQIVAEKLAASQNIDHAFQALELTTKAMGYGARAANIGVQQNFVVAVPSKAQSSQSWAETHGPQLAAASPQVIEMSPDLAKMVAAGGN